MEKVLAEILEELRAIREDMNNSAMVTAGAENDIRKLVRRWHEEGMPPCRG